MKPLVAIAIAWACALGCTQSHTVVDDAGTSVEDAGEAPDASADAGPPPEPCTTPGAIQTVGCGRCGSAERFCTSALVWEVSACTEPAGAECTPGTTTTEACGMCGTQTVRCTDECQWLPSGACTGETGECVPGLADRTSDGCAAGSSRLRRCSPTCAWGSFGACEARPTDFDGDGAAYEVDCDDTSAEVRPGVAAPCGSFVCDATMPSPPMAGTRTCVGPGWTECMRPAACPEPTSCPFPFPGGESETSPCASSGCDGTPPVVRTRRCDFGTGAWGPWMPASCPAPGSGSACPVAERACGACGEGVEYEICDGACAREWTACYGAGCVPGTSRREAGCPAGQYRVRTCDAACSLGPPGPCIDGRPELDVMLLVDVTGSHTSIVMGNAAALSTELVGPLLSDMSVHVGVATFADYPYSPYGQPGDLPFHGILEPTSDLAAVQAALASLVGMGGGDGPESGVEALYVLAGGTAHPSSRVFSCPADRVGGGCWRPLADRAIVIVTDIAQHNAPHPMLAAGALVDPYTLVPAPSPPTWAEARALLAAGSFGLFAIAPESSPFPEPQHQPVPQLRTFATDLGEDGAEVVVTYPGGSTDLSEAARTMAMRLAAHYAP